MSQMTGIFFAKSPQEEQVLSLIRLALFPGELAVRHHIYTLL
jgi:hypothetical protein